MAEGQRKSSRSRSAESIPRMALSYGQTIWLMSELGLRQGVSLSTFNSYIKSLRKIGIPFEKKGAGLRAHRNVTYNFDELMELTLALLLRVYNWLPDSVASGLRAFRDDLRPIYRAAYRDSRRPVHPKAWLSTDEDERIAVEGLFLDLNIRYAAGHMVDFGPPRTMSPFEAMSVYASSQSPARAYLPLNVTVVAQMIVDKGRLAPVIPRGRAARRRVGAQGCRQ
jgi:hypothetical protein